MPNDDDDPTGLIGQVFQGSVSASGCTLSDYNWSVEGPNFKSYYVATDESSAHVNYLDSTDLTSATPTWSWLEEGDPVVSATVEVWVGTQDLGAATATKTITVWEPYLYFAPETNDITTFYAYPTQDAVQAGDFNASPFVPSIIVFGRIGTPDLFVSAQGYGQWMYTQVIWGTRDQGSADPSSLVVDQYTLDNAFKYPGGHGPGSYDFTADSVDSPGLTDYYALDAPSQGLSPANDYYDIDNNFRMVQMFLPPSNGIGRYYVPTCDLTWAWEAAGSRTLPALWPDPPLGAVTNNGESRTTDHPVWDQKFTNGL